MFDLSGILPLPLIWGCLIALAVFIYVLLDGFDLGVGILFPFAPSKKCRDTMVSSIAPFWDGNETWLVLGIGGLLVAFPVAYGITLSALYIPATFMLFGLVFRGVSFEFRFKASPKSRWIWDYGFHFGSLLAAFCQGLMLGAFIQGFDVSGRSFSGSVLDWLSAFSLFCGLAVIMGYALLGATWTIMKTTDKTAKWARRCALYVLAYTMFCMGIVSLWTPFLNDHLYARWFDHAHILWILPLLSSVVIYLLVKSLLNNNTEYTPYLYTAGLFVLCYIGFATSLWPWIVPYTMTFEHAAANSQNLSLLFVGAALVLPVILTYTAYCYWVFRGKSHHENY